MLCLIGSEGGEARPARCVIASMPTLMADVNTGMGEGYVQGVFRF